MTQPTLADYLKLHFIVLILGFTAILGRLTDVSAMGVVFFRTLIAVIGLTLLMRWQRKTLKTSPVMRKKLLLTGVLVAAHWMCFFGSARAATVAVSLVCFSTTSFFTSLIEPYFLKRPVRWYEVALGLLVIAGIGVVFTFESQYLTGIILGLIAAVLAAVFSVLNARFTQNTEAASITFYEMLGACLGSLLLIPPILLLFPETRFQLLPSPGDWKWLLILGIVCTVYPYVEMLNLLKKMSAFTVNLSINMEPIYGILLAYVIFGESERMTTGFYSGAVLILLTVLAHPLLRHWDNRRLANNS